MMNSPSEVDNPNKDPSQLGQGGANQSAHETTVSDPASVDDEVSSNSQATLLAKNEQLLNFRVAKEEGDHKVLQAFIDSINAELDAFSDAVSGLILSKSGDDIARFTYKRHDYTNGYDDYSWQDLSYRPALKYARLAELQNSFAAPFQNNILVVQSEIESLREDSEVMSELQWIYDEAVKTVGRSRREPEESSILQAALDSDDFEELLLKKEITVAGCCSLAVLLPHNGLGREGWVALNKFGGIEVLPADGAPEVVAEIHLEERAGALFDEVRGLRIPAYFIEEFGVPKLLSALTELGIYREMAMLLGQSQGNLALSLTEEFQREHLIALGVSSKLFAGYSMRNKGGRDFHEGGMRLDELIENGVKLRNFALTSSLWPTERPAEIQRIPLELAREAFTAPPVQWRTADSSVSEPSSFNLVIDYETEDTILSFVVTRTCPFDTKIVKVTFGCQRFSQEGEEIFSICFEDSFAVRSLYELVAHGVKASRAVSPAAHGD